MIQDESTLYAVKSAKMHVEGRKEAYYEGTFVD